MWSLAVFSQPFRVPAWVVLGLPLSKARFRQQEALWLSRLQQFLPSRRSFREEKWAFLYLVSLSLHLIAQTMNYDVE